MNIGCNIKITIGIFWSNQIIIEIPCLRRLDLLPLILGCLTYAEEIGDMVSLKRFHFYESSIESIPPTIGRLRNLKVLVLEEAKKIAQLPEEIGDLKSLEILNLRNSSIESIPGSIAKLMKLVNLRILNLSGMSNTLFPVSMESLSGGMVCLREVYIYGTNQ